MADSFFRYLRALTSLPGWMRRKSPHTCKGRKDAAPSEYDSRLERIPARNATTSCERNCAMEALRAMSYGRVKTPPFHLGRASAGSIVPPGLFDFRFLVPAVLEAGGWKLEGEDKRRVPG